jgi:threonine dehydratase
VLIDELASELRMAGSAVHPNRASHAMQDLTYRARSILEDAGEIALVAAIQDSCQRGKTIVLITHLTSIVDAWRGRATRIWLRP